VVFLAGILGVVLFIGPYLLYTVYNNSIEGDRYG